MVNPDSVTDDFGNKPIAVTPRPAGCASLQFFSSLPNLTIPSGVKAFQCTASVEISPGESYTHLGAASILTSLPIRAEQTNIGQQWHSSCSSVQQCARERPGHVTSK